MPRPAGSGGGVLLDERHGRDVRQSRRGCGTQAERAHRIAGPRALAHGGSSCTPQALSPTTGLILRCADTERRATASPRRAVEARWLSWLSRWTRSRRPPTTDRRLRRFCIRRMAAVMSSLPLPSKALAATAWDISHGWPGCCARVRTSARPRNARVPDRRARSADGHGVDLAPARPRHRRASSSS